MELSNSESEQPTEFALQAYVNRLVCDEATKQFRDNCKFLCQDLDIVTKDEKWKIVYQKIVNFIANFKTKRVEMLQGGITEFVNYEMLIWHYRQQLVNRVSWCLFDLTLAEKIATYLLDQNIFKLLDPLAGTGFIARLLKRANLEVFCYDIEPAAQTWLPVQPMDASQLDLDQYQDAALLCSWVPMSDVGQELIRRYKGPVVIWIGENNGGCTGNGQDLAILIKKWHLDLELPLVQYPGLHDRLLIFKRK